MDMQQLHSLVSRYAVALNIKAPQIRINNDPNGPCYQPIQHRLNMDRETLKRSDGAVAAIVAHEMGHARQRSSLLKEFALTLSTLLLAVVVLPGLVAVLGCSGYWRPPAFLVSMLAGRALYMRFWSDRIDYFAFEREIEADEVSARFCGAAATLAALDAIIEQYGRIEFQEGRREALLNLLDVENDS